LQTRIPPKHSLLLIEKCFHARRLLAIIRTNCYRACNKPEIRMVSKVYVANRIGNTVSVMTAFHPAGGPRLALRNGCNGSTAAVRERPGKRRLLARQRRDPGRTRAQLPRGSGNPHHGPARAGFFGQPGGSKGAVYRWLIEVSPDAGASATACARETYQLIS
jgi:hypothetical protein